MTSHLKAANWEVKELEIDCVRRNDEKFGWLETRSISVVITGEQHSRRVNSNTTKTATKQTMKATACLILNCSRSIPTHTVESVTVELYHHIRVASITTAWLCARKKRGGFLLLFRGPIALGEL